MIMSSVDGVKTKRRNRIFSFPVHFQAGLHVGFSEFPKGLLNQFSAHHQVSGGQGLNVKATTRYEHFKLSGLSEWCERLCRHERINLMITS